MFRKLTGYGDRFGKTKGIASVLTISEGGEAIVGICRSKRALFWPRFGSQEVFAFVIEVDRAAMV